MSKYSTDPKSDPALSTFQKHDRVRHAEYGRGYVVSTVRENAKVFFLQDGKTRDLKQNTLEASE
jgi:hypothetical protein